MLVILMPVHRRAGSVLVGIADGITGHRGLVRFRALEVLLAEASTKPSSKDFFALSQAPPPEVIEMATKMPVTITPSSMAPTAEKAWLLPAIRFTTKKITTGASTAAATE